jgi:nucleoside-diphosphate-sugar epimerase
MWAILAAVFVLGALYARRLNRLMQSQSPEALALAPKRWTDEEIKANYQQFCKAPLDVKPFLPSKTGNRYIVVGGNGFVGELEPLKPISPLMINSGGWIVLHLLQRGEDPSNIRILDIRSPIRRDLRDGAASRVPFVKVDVTNMEEVKKAFNLPWPSNAPRKEPPLTVFHTAAVIRFFERSSALKHLSSKINVLGTQNVLAAASQAGASYFIFTSSGSVHNQVINYFVSPWKKQPGNFLQVISESSPIPTGQSCISNYTQSKADADNIVLSCNGKGTHNGFMHTGTLRPGSMIFGPGSNLFHTSKFMIDQTVK